MPYKNDVSDLLKFAAGILTTTAFFAAAALFGYLAINNQLGDELRFLQAKVSEVLKIIKGLLGQ